MTTQSDVTPVSEFSTPTYGATPVGHADSDDTGLDLHQEINERRARVENAELLQHLRGL